eukprot:3324563-Rhodomonas_salina.1
MSTVAKRQVHTSHYNPSRTPHVMAERDGTPRVEADMPHVRRPKSSNWLCREFSVSEREQRRAWTT